MNDTIFLNQFHFNQYYFKQTYQRDYSKGIGLHFIGYMRHGQGRIISKEQTLEIRENEMFYIPKGYRYRSHWMADDYVCFDSIGFLYFPTVSTNGYVLQKIEQTDIIRQAFRPFLENKTVNATSIGALYHLLGILESELMPEPLSRNADIYEKAVRYMQKDPNKTVPQYARLCGVSESALYQYTKKLTGKTPNRIRQEILCQKAAELLTTTNYTIEEICDRLRFSSAAYFRKIFHEIYGKSPSQFRKEGHAI